MQICVAGSVEMKVLIQDLSSDWVFSWGKDRDGGIAHIMVLNKVHGGIIAEFALGK